MASAVIGSLRVDLGINSAQFSEGLRKAQKSLSGFGKSMQRIGAGMTAAVSLPLAALGKGMIEAASNAVETASAFDHLFKDQAGDVRKWADETAKALGRSTFALQEQALAFQQYFSQVAPTNEQAAEMSKQFTQLSQDLASFYNVTESDALQKLRSGLAGEAEPLRAFGVFLSAAAVEAKALELGLVGTNNELTEQEKVMARAAVIMEQTAAAQGDAARTSQGFANQSKALNAALSDIGIKLGTILLPAALKVVSALSKLAEWFATLSPQTQEWIVIIGGAAAILGPVVATLGLFVAGIAAIGAPLALVIAGLAAFGTAVVVFREEIAAADQAIMTWARNFDAAFLAAFEAARAKIVEFGAAIASFVAGAWAQFEAAWDGMVQKVHAVKDSIVQFAAEIPGIFANLASQMVEIGAQIIDGLWQGIQSKFATVKEGISNLASSLASTVRSTLGIQSPSRVFMEIGNFIMQGLGLGMEKQQSYVVGVATSTANQAVSATKDAWAGMRDVTKETAGAFEDAFSRIGSSIGEGLTGAKKWKEVLKDIIQQLAQMAFSGMGAGGGGIGNIFQSLLGGLFGFASGGSFQVGGAGGIDSQLVAFKASPNERVSVTKPGQERGGGIAGVRVFVDQDGNWQAKVEEIASGAAQPVAQRAANSAVGNYNYSQQHGGARANDHYFQRLKRRA